MLKTVDNIFNISSAVFDTKLYNYSCTNVLLIYYCCEVNIAAPLLNDGTNTVKIEDLFNKDSKRAFVLCVGGFFKPKYRYYQT